MTNFFRLSLLAVLLAVPAALAQRKIGEVTITVDKHQIPVHVSGATPELDALARAAFNVHGRYRLVASGGEYDIRFSPAGGGQVRVDIARGLGVTPVASEVATGSDLHHALFRAADVAVEKTNGLGLRGFFTAQLAFLRDFGRAKEVCTSDLLFTPGEVKQYTHSNAQVLSPRWSPDGSRILFTSYLKGFPDIYALDLMNGQLSEFARYKGTNTGARFSPDGRRVAMVCTGFDATQIYVTNAQGTHPTPLTRSDAVKSSPCFSPDGSRIVYAQALGTNPQLYLISAAGGAPQRLSTGFRYAAEPDWSRANPNKIACTVMTDGSYQIAVYDLSKGAAEVVSHADFDAIEPSWLADGRHLVYTARNRTTSVRCILDTETGQSRRISPPSLGSTLEANVWMPR